MSSYNTSVDWLVYDIAWFSSVCSEQICIFLVLYIFKKFFFTLLLLLFSELNLLGMALNLAHSAF